MSRVTKGPVLRGLSRTLEGRRPDVLIEIHPSLLEQGGDSVASVVGSLTDRGYRLLDLDGGAVRPDRLYRQADVFRVFATRERPAA